MLQTVAIRTPKHLCIKDNALVIREKKSSEVIGKIALSDIWVIIIDNPQVTMTRALMSGIGYVGIIMKSIEQRPVRREKTPAEGIPSRDLDTVALLIGRQAAVKAVG